MYIHTMHANPRDNAVLLQLIMVVAKFVIACKVTMFHQIHDFVWWCVTHLNEMYCRCIVVFISIFTQGWVYKDGGCYVTPTGFWDNDNHRWRMMLVMLMNRLLYGEVRYSEIKQYILHARSPCDHSKSHSLARLEFQMDEYPSMEFASVLLELDLNEDTIYCKFTPIGKSIRKQFDLQYPVLFNLLRFPSGFMEIIPVNNNYNSPENILSEIEAVAGGAS